MPKVTLKKRWIGAPGKDIGDVIEITKDQADDLCSRGKNPKKPGSTTIAKRVVGLSKEPELKPKKQGD